MAACLVVTSAAPSPASASGDSEEYSRAVNQGLAEFDEKNFAEARAHFVRAHELAPSARTLRALGMVEFELKHYAESARLLREALASKERPLDADKRAHVQELINRADGYLGTLEIVADTDVNVSVDDVTTPLGPNHELYLAVGDHTLSFSAAERIPQTRKVTIRGREHSRLEVKLVPVVIPKSEQRAGAPNAPVRSERSVVKNPWLWTAIGVVVIGAAAGTAVALTRDPSTTTEPPYRGSTNVLLGTP